MHFPNIRKNRHITDATGKKIEFILILLALMVLVLLSKKLEKYASGEIVKLTEKEKKSQVIVLDAGHGGSDPGKIGVHEEKEKEINLEIALKVEKMLKKKKIKVIMTRTDDQMLDDQSDAGQKVRDLRERVRKINGEKPVFAVTRTVTRTPESMGRRCFITAIRQRVNRLQRQCRKHCGQQISEIQDRRKQTILIIC